MKSPISDVQAPDEVFKTWVDDLPRPDITASDGDSEGEDEQGWRDEYKPTEPEPGEAEPDEKEWLDELRTGEDDPEPEPAESDDSE